LTHLPLNFFAVPSRGRASLSIADAAAFDSLLGFAEEGLEAVGWVRLVAEGTQAERRLPKQDGGSILT
jgi:hypothetical protein